LANFTAFSTDLSNEKLNCYLAVTGLTHFIAEVLLANQTLPKSRPRQKEAEREINAETNTKEKQFK